MTEPEQLAFIREQEQRISAMMGDRPAKLSDEAVRAIKVQVDSYVARDGTGPDREKLSVSVRTSHALHSADCAFICGAQGSGNHRSLSAR